MQKFTVSVYINRSQQGVFDFLSNAANFQRWMPLMQSAAWTSSGEPGVGTTGRGIMKMAGREMELLLEVTRWDVPGRLGFKILNNVFPMEATEYVYRLEPEDGGTRLTLDGEFELVRVLRFAGGLMGRMYVKSNRNELNGRGHDHAPAHSFPGLRCNRRRVGGGNALDRAKLRVDS